MEELEDMTNPENAQYFGHKEPYPLEVNAYHRFLIPQYKNEVDTTELKLFLVGDEETEIDSRLTIDNNKLFVVTLISFEEIQGHFEIRDSSGTVLFYSNCVKFVNSTDKEGRKYIRIATKCTYNRNLFSYSDGEHDWMITNLPAYCLGEFEIDEDITLERTGNLLGSEISGSWYEENVKYRILAQGDNNILAFIAVHSANQDFYIDGTKMTRKEKPEVTDNTQEVIMKFSYQKDENGLNIILDEKKIFSDAFKYALGNKEKTKVYVYDNNKAIKTR
ncbi:hypothetical protein [Chryseobacterium sp. SG20098]|uniref:hypothetical protein n=1 Tax=Chryseobacterium sp. SG20098 TaxID=3074145 RepID=UPI0028830B6F|nr:hypothetical protein [Chryseobacterium sp. SG20098]WNI34736.1 hypothetical protein RHP76_12180 [Chryseobacterium sp. SG20098]